MLIIAGVTIGITTDRDGLIDKAKEQVDETNDRIAKDEEATQGIIDEIKGELDVNVSGIVLDTTSVTLKIGDTKTLTATVVPQNSPNKVVTWSSSDSSVVTVNNGLITAIKVGTAVITVSCGGKDATCEVTVTTRVTPQITLSQSTIAVEPNATVNLTAKLNIEPTQDIVWTSSDDTIATVVGNDTHNSVATITGLTAGGTAIITATYDNISEACTVNIKRLIPFTIKGYDDIVYAVEGWDWKTWANSSYDPIGLVIHSVEDSPVYWPYGGCPLRLNGEVVSEDNIIQENQHYTWEEM